MKNGQGVGSIIARGGAISFVMATATMALGFLTNVLLSRSLGISEFGLYSILLGWCMILAVPATAGMDFAILRFAPIYLEKGQRKPLRNLIKFALFFAGAASALCALIVFSITIFFPNAISNIGLGLALLMSALIALTALMGIFAAVFRAWQKVFFYQFYDQLLRAVLIVTVLGCAIIYGWNVDAFAVFVLIVSCALLCLTLQVIHLSRLSVPDAVNQNAQPPKVARRDWVMMALPALVAAAMQQVLVQSGLVILGAVSTPEQAGLFAATSRLSAFITFGLSATAAITAPLIVRAFAYGDTLGLQRIATINTQLALASAIPVFAIYVIFGMEILSIFGPNFVEAYVILLVLSGSAIFSSATGVCAALLLFSERQIIASKIMLAVVLAQVTVSIPLATNHGALGAAFGVFLGLILKNGLMSYLVYKHLNVNVIKFWK